MQATDASTQALSVDTTADRMMAVMHRCMTGSDTQVVAAVDELGVSLSQVKLLAVLEQEPELPLKALGETLGLSLPAVSRAVDGLVKRGFVTREECPGDRRSKVVRITPEGLDTTRQIRALRFAALRSFVVSLTTEEHQALAHAFDLLARRPEIAAYVAMETPTDD